MMHMAHLTVHSFIGIGSHTAVNPPSVVPVITPHISMDTLLGLTIKAKYSKTVIGPFGFQFIGQGNDSGFVVPHIGIPPNNVLIPLIIFFGGSKPMFAASTVMIDVDGAGKPVACNLPPVVPVGVNQACNDPCNYPSDIVICPNSVVVGMTLGDFLSGVALILLDCLISYVASKLGGQLGEHMVKAVLSVAMRQTAKELAEEIGEKAGESLLRDIVENVAERPLAHLASQLVEKLFGTGVDAIQDGLGVGEYADQSVREAADGSPSGPAGAGAPSSLASTGDTIGGYDGSDPRINTAD